MTIEIWVAVWAIVFWTVIYAGEKHNDRSTYRDEQEKFRRKMDEWRNKWSDK